MRTIKQHEKLLLPCPRKCNICPDRPNSHHWMLDYPEDKPEGRLICRHCPAVIEGFDPSDRNCPSV